jgi:hypothetical protein
VDTFQADFAKATKLERKLCSEIIEKYNFDPRISNTKTRRYKTGRDGSRIKTEIWSKRERFIYYNSIVEGFKRPLYSQNITTFYRKKKSQIRKEVSNTERQRQELSLKQRYEQFVVWLVDGCLVPISEADHDKNTYAALKSWQQGLLELTRSRRNAIKQEYERKWKEFISQPDIQSEVRKKRRLADFERGLAFLNPLQEVRSKRKKALKQEDVVRASIAGWEWRQSVRAAVARYDRVRDFRRLYEAADLQLKQQSGILPIRSRFYLIINRRYQPRDMWPTYVGDWSRDDDVWRWMSARNGDPSRRRSRAGPSRSIATRRTSSSSRLWLCLF